MASKLHEPQSRRVKTREREKAFKNKIYSRKLIASRWDSNVYLGRQLLDPRANERVPLLIRLAGCCALESWRVIHVIQPYYCHWPVSVFTSVDLVNESNWFSFHHFKKNFYFNSFIIIISPNLSWLGIHVYR
jgi:hypothetical protein